MDDEFGATVGDMDSEISATGLLDDLTAEYRANSDLFPEMDASNTAEDGEINTTQDTAFYQVYCILAEMKVHNSDGKYVLPVLYALLKDKSKSSYLKMFQLIKETWPNFNPALINMDFEQVTIEAAREKFPGVRIAGCFFHLIKNFKKKLANSAISLEYRRNQEFAVKARMLMSLVFVPPANAQNIFQELKTELGAQMMRKLNPIFKWFQTYYLGTPGREATFPIALWTAYERTLAGEDRTNNFAEAAHRKLQSLFGVDHPSLGNFLDRLKKAQKSHDRTYEEYVMGKPPQKKRKKYLDADKRILNLVKSFEGRNTAQSRMEYLKGLAYNFVMDQ